jgi:hypothetical protein
MGSIQRNCQKKREREIRIQEIIWSTEWEVTKIPKDANQTMQLKRETCYGIQQKKSNKDDGKENIFKLSMEL